MRLINSFVILCNLYTNVICNFYTDLSSEALYSQIGLRNIRETITYPRTDTSYNVEVLQPPSEKDFWKSYLDNTLQGTNTEGYIRPIRADYKAQITYLKPVINTRPNHLPIPQKIHWQTLNPVVIKPPTPPQKTKLEVVKVKKAPLVEALNLAKFLHHREPIPSMIEPHLQGIMPKKVPEVVVNVNLAYKRNQLKKDLSASTVSKPINIDQNKYHRITENKAKMLGKPIIGTPVLKKVPSEKQTMEPTPRPSRRQIKEFQKNEIEEEEEDEEEEEEEQHEEINPHHLLKSGKMKLKETKLSEHDSIVEVIMPQKQLKKASAASTKPSPSSASSSSGSSESSSESGEQEDNANEKSESSSSSSSTCQLCKCGESKKNDGNSSGNSSGEIAPTCNCAQRPPPIIKNRFVVLHLKEKMIKDPLIKFLAKV